MSYRVMRGPYRTYVQSFVDAVRFGRVARDGFAIEGLVDGEWVVMFVME